MIKKLRLQNFKCFKDSPQFSFSRINLLTGINGRGKSSLLQALLILSQSARRNSDMMNLFINDELLQLGNFDDIKNSETARGKDIYFQIEIINPFVRQFIFKYIENESNPLIADLHEAEIIDTKGTISKHPLSKKAHNDNLLIFSEIIKKIHYVSADRLGPIKYVDKTTLPEFIHVGVRGEHCINILANSGNLPLIADSLYLGQDAKTILQQAEEWLNYILEGAKLEIIGKEKQSSVLSLLLNSRNNSYSYKQNNVGFGYSYVLPLILSGLISKEGEMLIIENPEAHLHPKAQSKITEFFSKVASNGVQVFLESHSEHILNALRVCALDPNIKINNEDISIYYFDDSYNATNLLIEKSGKIKNWPEGFFDQQEIDLSTIFKFSR